MAERTDDLLRPTLGGARLAKAPYSTTTMFLTAFFGGVFAAIAIVAVNAVRLERWRRDAVVLGLAAALYVAFLLALAWTEWGAAFRAELTAFAGARGLSYLSRALAIGVFGLGYVLHRTEQRSADLMGLERPNGWIAGIACIVGGGLAQFAVAMLLFGGDSP